MNKGIILSLPRYDTVTEYLSQFSLEIENLGEVKGLAVKTIRDKSVTKKEFEKVVKKLNYNFLVLNGHGTHDSILGHNDEVIIKLGENEYLLKGRITYCRSCDAGAMLGKNCLDSSGNGCFIGYRTKFEFCFDGMWESTPLKDETARLFLEPSNLVPISLIKGNSTKEAHEKSRNKILKNIKKLFRSKRQEAPFIAESLWNNYFGQVLFGNENARIE